MVPHLRRVVVCTPLLPGIKQEGATTALRVGGKGIPRTCSPGGRRRWRSSLRRGGARSASPSCSVAATYSGSGTAAAVTAGGGEEGIGMRGNTGGRGRRWWHHRRCQWRLTRFRRAGRAAFLCLSVGMENRECVWCEGRRLMLGGWSEGGEVCKCVITSIRGDAVFLSRPGAGPLSMLSSEVQPLAYVLA